jgi:hypothetical protein
MIWKHLLDSLYNKEISNNEDTDKEFDIMFDIDPPQPVPLKRQKVCTSESDIKQAMMESLDLDKLDKNQIMFNMVNNIIIETNFFYKGNAVIGSARYYYPNEILSETYNKYSILWLPDYYEWRFNNLLIRRLYKNQTANFPDSPSIVKFSILTEWKNEGIVWSQTPFEYAIKSVKLQCPITFILNDTITYKEKVQNYSNKNNLSTILLFVVFGISMMTI